MDELLRRQSLVIHDIKYVEAYQRSWCKVANDSNAFYFKTNDGVELAEIDKRVPFTDEHRRAADHLVLLLLEYNGQFAEEAVESMMTVSRTDGSYLVEYEGRGPEDTWHWHANSLCADAFNVAHSA